MKKPLEMKIRIDNEANYATEPAGYIISNRPVISTFDGKTLSVKEIKRDWIKELKALIKKEDK